MSMQTPATQQLPPLFIVMNAASGHGDAKAIREDLTALLRNADQPFDLLLCSRPADLAMVTKQAIERAMHCNGIVAAAGGDGTIRTVAQQVLVAGLRFGVVPLGTFNYFVRDNGLPQEPLAAIQALVAGIRADSERPVQVGQLNEQIFLVNASIGLYPQLLEDREVFKRRYGRNRMVARWSGLLTLLRRDVEMRLRLDCVTGQCPPSNDLIRACTLFVGNNALQLDQVGLVENDMPEGQFAVLVLPPMNVLERLFIALRGMLGKLGSARNADHFLCRCLSVEPLARPRLQKVKVAMDGESAWMRPPLAFSVAPRRLRLVVPPVAPGEA